MPRMRKALSCVVMLVVAIIATTAEGSEISLRGGLLGGLELRTQNSLIDADGVAPSATGLWAPSGAGRLRPILVVSTASFKNDFSCSFECEDFEVRSQVHSLGAGVRWHLGDLERRARSLYVEVSPAIMYARLNVTGGGFSPGERVDKTDSHLLLGVVASLVAPVRLSESATLELGLQYLFSEDLGKSGETGYFSEDLRGFRQLGFQVGFGLR